MKFSEVQTISDSGGNVTAVVVLIELWREIESEKKPLTCCKART